MKTLPTSRRNVRAFTMIELMVVVAVIAVVLSVAAPSFTTFLTKKRVDSTMSELSTDLQFARSEAVSLNAPVQISFVSSTCYVVHLSSVTAPSTCTTTNMLKTQQLDTGYAANFSPNNSLSYIKFDPVRGMATYDGSGTVASVIVKNSSSTLQLQANVCTMGRVVICSPNGSFNPYTQSCPSAC